MKLGAIGLGVICLFAFAAIIFPTFIYWIWNSFEMGVFLFGDVLPERLLHPSFGEIFLAWNLWTIICHPFKSTVTTSS